MGPPVMLAIGTPPPVASLRAHDAASISAIIEARRDARARCQLKGAIAAFAGDAGIEARRWRMSILIICQEYILSLGSFYRSMSFAPELRLCFVTC